MFIAERITPDTQSDLGLFENHHAKIQEALEVLGYPAKRRTLSEINGLTRGWTKTNHWQPESQDQYPAEQKATLTGIFRSMGLIEAVLPAKAQYDHVVILGGMALGNLRYARYIKQLVEDDQIHLPHDVPIDLLAGQRLREPGENKNLTDMLHAIDRQGITDKWVRHENQKPGEGWERPFATEAELARLALVTVFGEMEQTEARLSAGLRPRLDSIPYRAVAWRSLVSPGGQKFRVMNAAAVRRAKQDSPRHTSSSSLAEWIDIAQPEAGAEILLVNSNPHMQRIATDAKRVFAERGREDLSFETVGPAALPHSPVNLFLGEIGRIVYNAANATTQKLAA